MSASENEKMEIPEESASISNEIPKSFSKNAPSENDNTDQYEESIKGLGTSPEKNDNFNNLFEIISRSNEIRPFLPGVILKSKNRRLYMVNLMSSVDALDRRYKKRKGFPSRSAKIRPSLSNKMSSETQNKYQNLEERADVFPEELLIDNEDSNQRDLWALEFSIKSHFDEFVLGLKKFQNLPPICSKLVFKYHLNTMIVDLYDYGKGFSTSFLKFGENEEISHGKYSYRVNIMDCIQGGKIPHEIFDCIYKYDFKIIYDGYIICHIRIHADQINYVRSHFVLLEPSIQVINGQSAVNCKENSSLDFQTESARLILHHSPNLCLTPYVSAKQVIIELALDSLFVTPELEEIIENEKERIEKVIQLKSVTSENKPESESSNLEEIEKMDETSENIFDSESNDQEGDEDWNFRFNVPTPEEVELSEIPSNLESNSSFMRSYLMGRKICFPDFESFTGSHVEIENFVYEYEVQIRGETGKNQHKLCISVCDDREYYYTAYIHCQKIRGLPLSWSPIGSREALDEYIVGVTNEELKMYRADLTITHSRIFHELTEVSGGKLKIVRQKLSAPSDELILPPPRHL